MRIFFFFFKTRALNLRNFRVFFLLIFLFLLARGFLKGVSLFKNNPFMDFLFHLYFSLHLFDVNAKICASLTSLRNILSQFVCVSVHAQFKRPYHFYKNNSLNNNNNAHLTGNPIKVPQQSKQCDQKKLLLHC